MKFANKIEYIIIACGVEIWGMCFNSSFVLTKRWSWSQLQTFAYFFPNPAPSCYLFQTPPLHVYLFQTPPLHVIYFKPRPFMLFISNPAPPCYLFQTPPLHVIYFKPRPSMLFISNPALPCYLFQTPPLHVIYSTQMIRLDRRIRDDRPTSIRPSHYLANFIVSKQHK